MDRIKSWFKSKFQPSPFDSRYDGVRTEFIYNLQLCDLMDEDNPDITQVVELVKKLQLINFVWNDELMTPMELACMRANPWCVAALIAHGADIHGIERNKKQLSRRPIHYACMTRKNEGKLDCVRMLVEIGADFRVADVNGDTPIQQATFTGSVEVVEYLLKAGADANSMGSSDKGPPLHLACIAPTFDDFQRFSKLHADRDDDDRLTYLKDKVNSEARQLQLIRVLLENGADVNKVVTSEPDADSMTIASSSLHLSRLLLLMSFGGDVNNVKCSENHCILKAVLEFASDESVQLDEFFITLRLLLAAGAKVSLASLENSLKPVLEERPQLAMVKGAVLQLLETYAAAPSPLKMLCRQSIRALIRPDKDATLKVFPLPEVLKDYLMFRDIAPQPASDAQE